MRIGNRNIEDIAKEIAEKEKRERENVGNKRENEADKGVGEDGGANTDITSQGDFWRMGGVNYRGNVGAYDLSKKLLEARTQDEHAEHARIAIPKGEFYTPDMPLSHSLFRAVYRLRDEPTKKQEVEEIRTFLQQSMRDHWLSTLTRIRYSSKGQKLDEVIHNYKQTDQYSVKKNIVGPDRKIIKADKGALKALLDDDNLQEIESIYKWLNETNTWIWRVNSRPMNIDERVAWFSADSNGAGLDCGRGAVNRYSSLGVRRAREKIGS